MLCILTVGQNHNNFPEISLLGGTCNTEEAGQGSFCVTVFLHPIPFLSSNVFNQSSFHMKIMGSGNKVQLQQVKINRKILNSCGSKRFTGELSINWWLTVADIIRQEHKYL